MKAMILKGISLIQESSRPLERVESPVPDPGAGQLLIQVSACGVCRIELDEIEGRTPPRKGLENGMIDGRFEVLYGQPAGNPCRPPG
jgi:D-arabinose 1-dehydrogenase-like Zn-dependent alcohol dehydrogenase